MRAAAQLAFGDVAARCPLCRTSDELREHWGCDKAASVAIYAIECPRCDAADPGCDLCDGDGELYVNRCPSSQIDRGTARVMQAYRWAREGVLPNSGGYCDQPAELMHAFSLLDRERGRIEEERERRAREAAKRRG